tara:strand:+ start:1005 stop:1214 length:210 start_codon:yes stop_codon:yes gene_type:complete
MKVYIVHYESLEGGYNIEGFSNIKKAISKVSNLKSEDRREIISLTKEPKIITKDLPISREGLLTAINYI